MRALHAALDTDPLGSIAHDGYDLYIAATTSDNQPVRIQLTAGQAVCLAAALLQEAVLNRDEEASL